MNAYCFGLNRIQTAWAAKNTGTKKNEEIIKRTNQKKNPSGEGSGGGRIGWVGAIGVSS